MSFLRLAIPAFVVSLVSIGCASSSGIANQAQVDAAADGATGPKLGSPCDTNDACGSTMYCGFDSAGGCAAAGTCRANEENGVCSEAAFVTFCSCSGGTVRFCGGPSPMYTSMRLAHSGPCSDGGADAATD